MAAVIGEQLPAVAAQGIARSCDVFCEAGVFTPDQARRILLAARASGLTSGSTRTSWRRPAGPSWPRSSARSRPTILAPRRAEGIQALGRAAAAGRPVVAVLLPTVSWFLGLDAREPARELIEAGIPVALATDFNPGPRPW